MAPQTAKSLMKEFRASFRRKKVVVDHAPKANIAKEAENQELAKLVEMKENLDDKLLSIYTDTDLLSFLRARSMEVKEAAKLVQLDENINRLLNMKDFQPSEDKLQYNFSSVIGHSKEGCLVRVINVGTADFKGIMHMMSTIDQLKILLWMIKKDKELQEQFNRKTGKICEQFVYIMNFEDLNMIQISYKPAFDTAMQALKLLQDHYHDTLKSILCINTPSFFASIFKLFKPVMQDSLQKRIKFLDQENFKEELSKIIDADVLPKYFGGERVDSKGDPMCKEIVAFGQRVPEICYASNFLSADDPDVVVATVAAGATLNFRYPVRNVGSTCHWHIQAKDNDIAIAVYTEPFPSGSETPRTRKKKEEDMTKLQQLTPIIRSQSQVCPEVGSALTWFTGNLVLHFDNTYSWMNSKEVLFKFSITPPSDPKSH